MEKVLQVDFSEAEVPEWNWTSPLVSMGAQTPGA